MPVLVQKYGGTSVNTPEKRAQVMDKIIAAKDKGYDVVVVVSAMGRKGEPYATDTLLDLLYAVGPQPSLRTKDLLASCGETISVCVVAHALEQRGYKACPMTGFQAGILTDNEFTNAEVQQVDTAKMRQALLDGNIVVVAGFQGWNAEKDITTLGRGGSDTTAIALGAALEAELVEIYTDVPGIAFTDPRVLPEAPYLKSIDFNSMYMLARTGAKVVHPRAVKTAIACNRPFVVRSTFSQEEGTVIGQPGENFAGMYGISLCKNAAVVHVQGSVPAGQWKDQAVDEYFYQHHDEGCCIAVPAGTALEGLEHCQHQALEGCDLLTVVWDPNSGLNSETILSALQAQGITVKGVFGVPAGGTWVVPEAQTNAALKALYALEPKKVAG